MHKAALVRIINNNLDLLAEEEGGALSVERLRRVMSGRRCAAGAGIGGGANDNADGSVGIGSNVAWADAHGRSTYGRVVSMVKRQTTDNGGSKRVQWRYPVPLTTENRPENLKLQVSTFRHTHQVNSTQVNAAAHKAAKELWYVGSETEVEFSAVAATGELKHTGNKKWAIGDEFRKETNTAILERRRRSSARGEE